MVSLCNGEDVSTVLQYMGTKYYEALYLYLDIKRYGTNDENVKSWIQRDGNDITSVILQYHNGMHIFSRNNDFCAEEISELIQAETPTNICGSKKVICRIKDVLPNYSPVFGHVAKYIPQDEINDYMIKKAGPEDYEYMADMLMEDESMGGSYSYDEMLTQISGRIEEGYSRSYCIYENNQIVAQASTGAECDGVATVAYVMTKNDYRGKGYGKRIASFLSKELSKEGFDVFLVYYKENAGKMYLNIGYENVCEYGKLLLITK